MGFGWQDLTTVVLVLAAAWYLGRRLWCLRAVDKPPSCSGCAGCGESAPARPLVTLGPPRRK